VSAQLFQILAQLDRDGATEVVIASGRQIAVRVNGAYQTLTANPVTMPQLLHLIRATPLAANAPNVIGVGDPEELELGGRPVRVQMIRNGADFMVRIEPSKPGAAVVPPSGRAARPSSRPKSKSVAPRSKTPSKSQPVVARVADDVLTLAPQDEKAPALHAQPTAPARPIVHPHPIVSSPGPGSGPPAFGPRASGPAAESNAADRLPPAAPLALAATSTGGLID
jgi:hypothetical protein